MGGTVMFELDMLSYLMGKKAGGGGSGGSGGGAVSQLDALLDKSITFVDSGATSIGKYTFENCKSLESANFPAATSIGEYAFAGCNVLANINFPAVTNIGKYAFNGCYNLKSVKFPAAETIAAYAFEYAGVQIVDFLVATSIALSFRTCTSLTALILRNNTMCSLTTANAFNSNTPIASGTGYIYVPSALASSYKSATNWKAYATQFRALENYTVDGTVTGELDESKI
jgi:hypothetical protein